MIKYTLIQALRASLVLFLLASCSENNSADIEGKSSKTESAVVHAKKHLDARYVCPMHPKIVKNEAGNCPICGMDLVKKETPKESAVEHAKKHLNVNYVCPMHPKIIKSEPGQSCPICGMDLVEKKMDLSTDTYPTVKLTADIVQKMGVRTHNVEKSQLWKFIKTVGYVSYNERRLKTISVRTDGWVENLSVRRVGLPVKKGQLLLELYSPEFLQLQKDFIEAQKKDKSGTLKKYGQRQESVDYRDRLRYMHVPESMMNEIARRGRPKYRLPIYSPMVGTIVEHNIHKHKYIEEDEAMFVIADLSTVWVEANVYEHQLEWVKRGLTAEIEVKAIPGKRFDAQITYIFPELDPKTRTLKVRLLVPNPDQLLKPNMFAEVRIFGGPKKDLLTIPREALIVTGERESVVLDLGNGQFKPVDVVSGMQSQGEVEILSGLKKGDRIVVSGQFLIDSEANLQASFSRFDSEQHSE